MLWSLALAAANPPGAEVRWTKDDARLHLLARPGTELALDAPVDARLTAAGRLLQFHADGLLLRDGLPLGPLRGAELSGTLDLQVCAKDTGICEPTTLQVEGAVPARRRGVQGLTVTRTDAFVPHSPSPFGADAAPQTDEAFAAARARDERVLLDFSAVWCPPCNLLAAEVLHGPTAAEDLAGLQLAVLDVDHPSSWTLKDRYQVGGYPTVVVTDAEGTEIDRLVGYPGRDAFLAFLARTRTAAPDDLDADPATLAPDDAARIALKLLDADRIGPAWVEAARPSDSVEAHLLRMRLEPREAEVVWLTEHAPERALDWLPHAFPWAERDGRDALLDALPVLLARSTPTAGADVLWFATGLQDEPNARLLYAAAAKILQAGLSGDPVHDKGHLEYLATLLDRSGDSEQALTVLADAARLHPDEPTFPLASAHVLLGHDRYAEALEQARLALQTAWGDNRLRVTAVAAEALVGLDRPEEARRLAEQVLAEIPAPAEDLHVRTHRYRQALERFRD